MEPKKANDPDELGGWRITGRLGEGGLARSHIGFMLIVEDANGLLIMGEEAHITDARKKRMSYAEEYYSLPEQSPIYEFECDQEEAILNWITAERNLFAPGEDFRDYLS
jgi:hypothetical protein